MGRLSRNVLPPRGSAQEEESKTDPESKCPQDEFSASAEDEAGQQVGTTGRDNSPGQYSVRHNGPGQRSRTTVRDKSPGQQSRPLDGL